MPELNDKEGITYTYPNRSCKECLRYPCFIGIEKRVCNFAKYGKTYIKKKGNAKIDESYALFIKKGRDQSRTIQIMR